MFVVCILVSLWEYQASREKVSYGNHEPCPQQWRDWSLCYDQTDRRVVQPLSCCFQLEPSFCVLIIVLLRLDLFVHNRRNHSQGNRFSKLHPLTVKYGVCPWAMGSLQCRRFPCVFSEMPPTLGMTTKLLEVKDVLASELFLLLETPREGLR